MLYPRAPIPGMMVREISKLSELKTSDFCNFETLLKGDVACYKQTINRPNAVITTKYFRFQMWRAKHIYKIYSLGQAPDFPTKSRPPRLFIQFFPYKTQRVYQPNAVQSQTKIWQNFRAILWIIKFFGHFYLWFSPIFTATGTSTKAPFAGLSSSTWCIGEVASLTSNQRHRCFLFCGCLFVVWM